MPPFSPLKPDKNETKQKTEIQMEISHSLSLSHAHTHTHSKSWDFSDWKSVTLLENGGLK